jgi:hypothetical protein
VHGDGLVDLLPCESIIFEMFHEFSLKIHGPGSHFGLVAKLARKLAFIEEVLAQAVTSTATMENQITDQLIYHTRRKI